VPNWKLTMTALSGKAPVNVAAAWPARSVPNVWVAAPLTVMVPVNVSVIETGVSVGVDGGGVVAASGSSAGKNNGGNGNQSEHRKSNLT
jgi:phage baseplate assembly protein gpV